MTEPARATERTDSRIDSRTAILRAATEEFAERGFAGARMEQIARRSGFNKALVYRHFGDREQLFDAVLDAQLAERLRLLSAAPRNTGDAMAAWSEANFADPTFGRFLMQEALEYEGAEPLRAGERRRYYQRQIEQISRAQSDGRLPAGLDPRFLFLALLSVSRCRRCCRRSRRS